ncbi:MAG TPA: hypothetical protein VGD36_17975, partial [Xanthobacteraceae bacterium]
MPLVPKPERLLQEIVAADCIGGAIRHLTSCSKAVPFAGTQRLAAANLHRFLQRPFSVKTGTAHSA